MSVQVVGELFHVLTRKELKDKKEARQLARELTKNFKVVDISQESTVRAMDICLKYDYAYWDSLIIASALESRCSILYTEDMQDGQSIESRLRIKNPFRQEMP